MGQNDQSFELIKILGTGGFAQTWRARIIDPDLLDEWGVEEVALKIPLSKQKESVLKKEVELNGSLYMRLTEMESQNIVKYFGFGIYDGKIVMVMKYVEGGSLRNMMGSIGKWKRIEPDRAIAIARGVLGGLSSIHKNHIIHRDIKPENILMDGETPKVTDLGIGRMLRPNELASTTIGTLFYMSPELLFEKYEGAGASFNTDIWSFGVTLYEMLCGRFPYGITEKMPLGDIAAIVKDGNIGLEFPGDAAIPLKLQSIVSNALKRNPSERYKTADKILEDLEKLDKSKEDNIEKEIGFIQQLFCDPTQTIGAENRFKEILKKYPDSARVCLCMGEFYNKCGNYEGAIEMFKKGTEKEPDNALLHWGIAMAYQKKEDFKSAVSSLKKALEIGLEPGLERYAKMLLITLKDKGGV